MTPCLFHYDIADVAPYINWVYFFHAWGFEPRYAAVSRVHGCYACRAAWRATFPVADRAKASEAARLFDDAQHLLDRLASEALHTHALLLLAPCNADGDDIILYADDAGCHTHMAAAKPVFRLAFLRQQQPLPGEPCLCLADFVRPAPTPDRIGIFAAAADAAIEERHPDDQYRHLLCQTLADRLAEATAECLHLHVRKELWGYAPDEHLTMADLHAERFQGIRPAVGYPSLPDQSLIFDIDRLLHLADIGISLTTSGAMRPHAAVSGFMLAHTQARHFAVGRITDEQLADYARRRNTTPEALRPFLARCLM